MKFGLKTEIVEEIEKILARFPQVKTVIIYGSRAKGNYRQGSDIDLTFKGNNLNVKILNKISLQFDNLLLPYTFDLSVFDQIDNTDLLDHIERVGRVFYQKELGKIIS